MAAVAGRGAFMAARGIGSLLGKVAGRVAGRGIGTAAGRVAGRGVGAAAGRGAAISNLERAGIASAIPGAQQKGEEEIDKKLENMSKNIMSKIESIKNLGSPGSAPIREAVDQSKQIEIATNKTIDYLEKILTDPNSNGCLVNGFAKLFEKSSPLVIGLITDFIIETALTDPNIRLIINSKIQDMMIEILDSLTPEERQNIVDNMDGECRKSYMLLKV